MMQSHPKPKYTVRCKRWENDWVRIEKHSFIFSTNKAVQLRNDLNLEFTIMYFSSTHACIQELGLWVLRWRLAEQ